MRPYVFGAVLSVLLFSLDCPVEAQPAAKVYRVGWLYNGLSSSTGFLDALRRELREHGYNEEKNFNFELRSAEEKPERLAALADDLVRLKVDLIVTGEPADGLVAKKSTKTIPIVISDTVTDPVARGLVESLARPAGNVTGFYTMADVLPGKRLEVLKESLPRLARVAVSLHPSAVGADQWTESQRVTRQLGLQLHRMAITNVDDYDGPFKAAVSAGSTAIAVTRHRLAHAPKNQKRIVELAAKYRLPAIYYREDFVEQGGLMSYGADEVEPVKRVAAMIDKILKGAKPADIPVEQSSKFEFIVNLKTAKQLGVNIPQWTLQKADRVIR